MSIISDANVITKSILAPAFSCFMTVVITAVFYWSYTDVNRASLLSDAAVAVNTTMLKSMVSLSEGHAALFRAVSWKGANVEQKLVDVAKAQALANVEATLTELKDVHTDRLALDQGEVSAIETGLLAYRDAVRQTNDMIDVDVFSAAMFMTDADDKFNALRKRAEAFSGQAERVQTEIKASATAKMRQSLWEVVGVSTIALVLSILAARVLGRTISVPIREITSTMERLANGDLDVAIPDGTRGDEVGAMARTVEVFKRNAIERARLEDKARQELVQRTQHQQRLEATTQSFAAVVTGLLTAVARSVEQLYAAADRLNTAADTAQRQSESAAAAIEQATANVQTVAAAGNELAGSINEIARQVAESAEITVTASGDAENTNVKINGLAEAAHRIGEIIEMIHVIAAQTNLLALNATIESARAGEAGKGFAVVANEVKHLAGQTARATEEITAQVSAIQTETSEAVTAIQGIAGTLVRMKEMSTSIASAVEEQGAATSEIVRSVESAASGTRHVSTSIGEVARTSHDTHDLADSVFQAARVLQEESHKLQAEVEKFFADVRSA